VLPPLLARAVDAWAAYYEAHRMVSVAVRWLHLAGLVVGAGTALVADRRVLVAWRGPHGAREAALAELRRSHRVVFPALAVIVLTGLLMTASDRGTFMGSRLYWGKLSLVALLLVNGTGLLALERAAQRDGASVWRRLGIVSAASLVLWLVVLFFGVWLTAAA